MAEVVNWATPPFSVADPSILPPATNCTVSPSGGGPMIAVTVAVNVTGCTSMEGFTDEVTVAAVFGMNRQHPLLVEVAIVPKSTTRGHGLLQRYPVTASEFILIGKETERSWERADDISTLWPSLKHLRANEWYSGLSLNRPFVKNTPQRLAERHRFEQECHPARTPRQKVHPKSFQSLRNAVGTIPARA